MYTLKSLTDGDLQKLFARVEPSLEGLSFDAAALATVIQYADGDARRFLNLLEQLRTSANSTGTRQVTALFVKDSTVAGARRFDKDGHELYDQISAFQKSCRGSSPNAALYWLARMLDGGADAKYIARRLIVMASEEVGNADPRALQVAMDAAQAYERLGSPEGEFARSTLRCISQWRRNQMPFIQRGTRQRPS